ncbi:hypothetical protein AB0A95_30620 [Micromonospora sp. NPDC049230]|uniref:hypothetical protein n=1 Tax=Micromonospora sp. NPDC049230 TaxID=3155502 RepID=UPI00340AC568
MARDDGLSFAQRLDRAGLSPQQRETSAATLLLAELAHEMNERLAAQASLLEEIRDRLPAPADSTAAADSGEGGGAGVQLREPQGPPADPDDSPDSTPGPQKTTGRAATRRPATKATASKTAPAKKTGGRA